MVEFLTTTSISAELEKLIKSAREEITLISPYLKVIGVTQLRELWPGMG